MPRCFIAVFFALVGFSTLTLGATQKNVMVIVVDDLRPQLKEFGAGPRLHGESLIRPPRDRFVG